MPYMIIITRSAARHATRKNIPNQENSNIIRCLSMYLLEDNVCTEKVCIKHIECHNMQTSGVHPSWACGCAGGAVEGCELQVDWRYRSI
jgi:hypothetical protein